MNAPLVKIFSTVKGASKAAFKAERVAAKMAFNAIRNEAPEAIRVLQEHAYRLPRKNILFGAVGGALAGGVSGDRDHPLSSILPRALSGAVLGAGVVGGVGVTRTIRRTLYDADPFRAIGAALGEFGRRSAFTTKGMGKRIYRSAATELPNMWQGVKGSKLYQGAASRASAAKSFAKAVPGRVPEAFNGITASHLAIGAGVGAFGGAAASDWHDPISTAKNSIIGAGMGAIGAGAISMASRMGSPAGVSAASHNASFLSGLRNRFGR